MIQLNYILFIFLNPYQRRIYLFHRSLFLVINFILRNIKNFSHPLNLKMNFSPSGYFCLLYVFIFFSIPIFLFKQGAAPSSESDVGLKWSSLPSKRLLLILQRPTKLGHLEELPCRFLTFFVFFLFRLFIFRFLYF